MSKRQLDRIDAEVRVEAKQSVSAERVAMTDGRLQRGARSRGIVLRAAVDIGSLDGLSGVSFGRLATATGQSKAGIQTLFVTKEALQLATAEYARRMFTEAVIEPARSTPRGIARLWGLIDGWLVYVSAPLFEGGCFWTATLAEFDSHPGPVRDALFDHQSQWLALLENEIGQAIGAGEIAGQDPQLVAFQIDAVLRSTNIALRGGDATSVDRAKRSVESMLASSR